MKILDDALKNDKLVNQEITIEESEISDVIFKDFETKNIDGETYLDSVYFNTATGAKGHLIDDVVRKEKRFIVDAKKGYYVKEKDGLLYVLMCDYLYDENKGWHWEEYGRYVASKKGAGIGDNKNFDSSAVDICGQQSITNFGFPGKIVYMSSAKKVMNDFYKTPVFLAHTAKEFATFLYAVNTGPEEMIQAGVWENNVFLPSFTTDLPIPEKAMDALNKYAALWKKETKKYCNDAERTRVSILQKVGNSCIMREFTLVIYPGHSCETMQSELFETCRLDLSLSENFYIGHGNMDIHIWMDNNLKSTPLEYTSYYIDEWLNIYNKTVEYIEDEKYSGNVDYTFKEAFDEYYKLHHVPPYRICICAAKIGLNPLLERAAKALRDDSLKIRDMVFNSVYDIFPHNMIDCVEDVFGKTDASKKDLYMALGYPKKLLKNAVKEEIPLHALSMVKQGFLEDENGFEYFIRLNDKDIEKIFKFIDYFDENDYIVIEDAMSVFAYLIQYFGLNNWKSYIDFLICFGNDEDTYADFQPYWTYIENLGKLAAINKDYIKSYKWNLWGRQLEDEIARQEKLLLQFEDNYEELLKSFSLLENDWKTYLYEENDLIITYPKTPEELVMDGITLRHCSKLFLKKAACGLTTILFIRRKDYPDRPYYTLEIRENMIRQCHGFADCNATPEIERFLKNFCKAKHIEYMDSREQLGVED